MIKISVYYEDNLVTELEQVEERDISIGRAAGCSIHLDEPSISRLHAVIRAQSGQWLLERKANFGAVLLNGQEVENAPLEGGEEISVGKFILRVNIEASRASVPSIASAGAGFAGSDDDDDGGGRTRFVSASSGGFFRFEPGGANVAEYSLDQPVAVFGRGSNCDVVLSEKKASRKHFEVRRQGLSFFLKDLNSANGTFVNDQRVEGEVELVPGDVVKVGESAIQFSVENKDFFRAQDQFLPVPAHLQEAVPMEPGGYVAGAESFGAFPAASDAGAAIDPPPPEEPPLSSTDFVGRAKRAWFNIPKAQRMRYLTIMVVACLVMALLGSPDEPKPKKAPVKAGSAAARSYENLTKKQQALVRTKYADLLKAQENKNHIGMKELAGQILVYVDDYKDTKDYETMATKALEKIEAERKERELQVQMEKRRTEVKALEDKGEIILAKVLADRRFRSELDALIQEVYAKDPSNNKVKVWLTKIKDKEEEDRRLAEEAHKREELKNRAEGALEAVRATFTAGRYIPALQEAATLSDIPWEEDGYRERVEALKNEIRGKLSSIIDPLLKDAAGQRGEGGDLVRARDLYNEVLKTDASNKEALDGLEAIYEVLHMRAKRLYAEAILAESVSDLNEAKDRFEKCLRAAPEKSIYRKRCRSKLARFESFGNIPGIGGSGSGGF